MIRVLLAPLAASCAAALLSAGLAMAQSPAQLAQQIPIPGMAAGRAPGDTVLPDGRAAVDMLADRLDRAAHRSQIAAEAPGSTPGLLSPLRPVQARGVARGSALRFDGERRSIDLALFVPVAGQLQSLRVATVSSINVLPERSSYRVFLNNVLLGEAQLEHFSAPGTAEFAVPAGLARAGTNDVRIELVQQHRIFCGPDASFALWSEVDLALSGGVLAGGGLAERIVEGHESFLLALGSVSAMGAAFEIRGADLLGANRDVWIGAITQRMAAALGGDPLMFRLTRSWSVAAPVRAPARITFLPATEPGITFQRGGDGAQVMVVAVPPVADPAALNALEALFPPSPQTARIPLLETGRPIPLSELGFRSIELFDRYSWTNVRFRLPDDYVILTNQKSQMTLTYIYADGLPYGSVLRIYINGVNVRVLPLRGEAGRVISDFPIRFEARHLRAGVNTLGFEVLVPGDPEDLPCPPRTTPVVAISDGSTIRAPYSPATYLPDMHFAFSALTPASLRRGDLAARDFDALEVLTLRAAFASAQSAGEGRVEARLNLISVDDLAQVPTAHYVLARRSVEAVLAPVQSQPDLTTQAPLAAFFRTEAPAGGTSVIERGWAWLRDGLQDALHWLHPQSAVVLDAWLAGRRGKAMLLQLDPLRPDEIWMIRAQGADVADIAAALTRARATGDGPRGQVSVLGHDGRWSNWIAPDREPVLLEPLTLGNLRYVLGNFVSAMPLRYVLLLSFLALLSSLLALRFVISTREN